MDVLWDGFKNIGIAMTFGAYHLYVMNDRWRVQQEIYRLQHEESKALLEQVRALHNTTRHPSVY